MRREIRRATANKIKPALCQLGFSFHGWVKSSLRIKPSLIQNLCLEIDLVEKLCFQTENVKLLKINKTG